MTTQDKANAFDWAALVTLSAMAIVPLLLAGDGDFTFSDASRHAMDGVFVLDACAEKPVQDPIGWAKRYYLTSPALGIGRYPPLLAVVQAPFYALLGVSAFTARLAGLIVWIAGLFFFYESVRTQTGRAGAFLASAALAAGPASVRWGAEAMLELPSTSFLLAGTYFYLKYLSQGSRWMLVCATSLVCMGGWTKQPAALLLVAMAVHLVWSKKLVLRDALPAGVCAGLLLVPLVVLSVLFGKANFAIVSGLGRTYPIWSADNWLYYVHQVPRWYLGWPLLVFLAAGGIFAIAGKMRKESRFPLVWVLVFYIFFSTIGLKSSRLAMYWTPGLAWLAGIGFACCVGYARRWIVVLATFTAIAAVAMTYVHALQRVPVMGNELLQVASRVMSFSPERVLYVGPQNGTFIFRLREVAGRNRPVTIRPL